MSLQASRSNRNGTRWAIRSGVVALVVGGLTVVMSPLPSTAAPTAPPPAAGADKQGASSDQGEALREARETKKQVEVLGQRTTNSTTLANPDGTLTSVKTQAPTRARAADGSLVPIDTALAVSGKRLQAKATNAKVSFRGSGSVSKSFVVPQTTSAASADGGGAGSTGDVASLDLPGSDAVTLGFGATLPAPTVTADTATYQLTATSALTATALDDGFATNVRLDAKPTVAPVYRFPLKTEGGLTPKLEHGVVNFVDTDGKVKASTRPLMMWDAQRDEGGDPNHTQAVDAQLVRTTGGWDLVLSPSMTWLSDPATQYPVVVDPTVVTKDGFDTFYYNGNTTDFGSEYYMRLGLYNDKINRIYMRWDTGQFVGKVVTSASLNLMQYIAGDCAPKQTNVFPTTTYSDFDSANVSINNDSAWKASASFNTGSSACSTPDAYISIDVTKIEGGWATGELTQRAMELRADKESDATYYKRFCSRNAAPSGTGHCEGTSGVPSLSVTYYPEIGQQSSYALVSHKLNDRAQSSVNTRNGNFLVKNTDINIAGTGRNLGVDHFYNSQSSDIGQLGAGWSLTVGPDVYLKRLGSNDRFEYVAPSGTHFGPFVRKTSSGNTNDFYEPSYGGSDVSLKDNADGTYTMTFHESQEKYTFSELGCTTCNKVMTADKDRNDNKITYGYNASRVFTTITDTRGRGLTVNHDTSGRITSIVEQTVWTSAPRTWTYHYNAAGLLDYYADPTPNGRTDYTYTSGLLTKITDPAQADGKRPATSITYTNAQATRLDYQSDAAGNTKGFTYRYGTSEINARLLCNNGNDDDTYSFYTIVTNVSDPQGGDTTYCYKDRSKPVGWSNDDGSDTEAKKRVYDGNGKRRTISYTPNNDTAKGTGQSNDGVTGGSTVYTYNVNNSLSKVTQPKDANGDTAGTTSFDYSTSSSSVAGGSFLPSSTTTTAQSCSAMSYDAKGNLTDTYAGLAPNAGGTCGASGGLRSHVERNDNGTPKYVETPIVGALASGDRSDSDRLLYTYEPSTTAFHKGELTKVVRPGGNSDCVYDRTGCTTYTYDAWSRVATTTDGNGKTTTYSYDNNDRITQVLTDGATSCNRLAGTCITYTFDGEGNLVARNDARGITSFTYDWLNHPVTQTQPDTTLLETTYDGAGNLTKYRQTLPGQSVDQVTYAYDAANNLTKITDSTGDYTYTYNDDARPTKLTLPTSSGVTISSAYFKSGKLKSITPAGGTGLPSYTYDYNDGSNEDSRIHKITTGGVTYDYDYDLPGRLTNVDASSGTDYTYSYDKDGNITKAVAGSDTTWYGYNENDELCWSGSNQGGSGDAMNENCGSAPSGNKSYNRDKQGNNLGTSTGPIHYNAQNQVDQISSTGGAGPINQTYYDQGNNLRANAGNDTFAAGSQLGVTGRLTSGTTAIYFTRDPNGQLINMHGSAGTYYYLLDRQGGPTTLISTTGAKAGSYTYDPYGKTTVNSGTSTTAAQTNPWRYTGGYQDPTDNYYKLGARYYDAAGHFTQADPVAGSLSRSEKYNSYGYTAGDPANNTDLSGQDTSNCAIGIVLSFAASYTFFSQTIKLAVAGLGGPGVEAVAAGTAIPIYLGSSFVFGYSLKQINDEC